MLDTPYENIIAQVILKLIQVMILSEVF